MNFGIAPQNSGRQSRASRSSSCDGWDGGALRRSSHGLRACICPESGQSAPALRYSCLVPDAVSREFPLVFFGCFPDDSQEICTKSDEAVVCTRAVAIKLCHARRRLHSSSTVKRRLMCACAVPRSPAPTRSSSCHLQVQTQRRARTSEGRKRTSRKSVRDFFCGSTEACRSRRAFHWSLD